MFHHNFEIVELACLIQENHISNDCSNAWLKMSHYEQQAHCPDAQQPEWLYFSTMVLHSLTQDLECEDYCHTISVARVSWPGRVRREMQGGFGRRRVRYQIRKVEKGVGNVKGMK